MFHVPHHRTAPLSKFASSSHSPPSRVPAGGFKVHVYTSSVFYASACTNTLRTPAPCVVRRTPPGAGHPRRTAIPPTCSLGSTLPAAVQSPTFATSTRFDGSSDQPPCLPERGPMGCCRPTQFSMKATPHPAVLPWRVVAPIIRRSSILRWAWQPRSADSGYSDSGNVYSGGGGSAY